jgi:hypothetical protein
MRCAVVLPHDEIGVRRTLQHRCRLLVAGVSLRRLRSGAPPRSGARAWSGCAVALRVRAAAEPECASRAAGDRHGGFLMEFGVLVPQGWRFDLQHIDGSAAKWDAVRRVSRELDRAGWDSLWVYDHFHTFPRKEV